MATYGLLQGLGRGLSQSSELLSRGMAEDREAERQRLREASTEARWKRQEQREDARNKVADDRYKAQSDRQDRLDKAAVSESSAQQQYRKDSLALQRDELNARTDTARKERIENTLNAYFKESERKGDAIDRKYDRLIDVAKSNGATDEVKSLYEARDAEHAALSQQTEAKLIPALKSFGAELQGTAFSSYYDELIKSESQPTTLSGNADPAMVQGVVSDLTGGSNNSRAAAVNNVLNQPGPQPSPTAAGNPMPSPGLLKPGFSSGIQSGMSGYNSPAMIDDSSITPLQQITTAAGRAVVGTKTGLLMDGLEYLNNNAIQPAWAWANTPTNQGRK